MQDKQRLELEKLELEVNSIKSQNESKKITFWFTIISSVAGLATFFGLFIKGLKL
ncbi:hypothetical protein JCM19232_4486 [Vibrio ishigakensis]|uniref:Uncharacterized protein n=1 Tax=Vibrio ishigakensis TaxID=1481914 RepID=A0A0B8PJ91_9VIBR|nr:hypothetical protein JCM19232_4486 [Vibrio ishigakensis]